MESFSVNPAALEHLSAEIKTQDGRIDAALAELKSKVDKLSAAWDGDAKAAYATAQANWTKSITAMNALLARISAETGNIRSEYMRQDRSSANRFSA